MCKLTRKLSSTRNTISQVSHHCVEYRILPGSRKSYSSSFMSPIYLFLIREVRGNHDRLCQNSAFVLLPNDTVCCIDRGVGGLEISAVVPMQFLVCDAVQSGGSLPMFQRNLPRSPGHPILIHRYVLSLFFLHDVVFLKRVKYFLQLLCTAEAA